MKNSFCLLLLISTFSFSQNIKATYLHKFVEDKEANLFSSENKPILYAHLYSNKKSLYSLLESNPYKTDSITTKEITLITESFAPSKNIIYKDFVNKTIYIEYNTSNTNFSIKDNLTNFEWNLVNEEIIIKGFKCKKATTSKEKFAITAWYCEDIPINDGPDRFYGLPGFILKVELGEFSVIEIDQFKVIDEKLIIEKPIQKSEYISKEQFIIQEKKIFQTQKNE